MDEGSALLHHLERKFNNTLTCLATCGTLSTGKISPNQKESICICGYDEELLQVVQGRLFVMLDKWHDIPRTEFTDHMILSDDVRDDLYCGRYILICVDVAACKNYFQICKVIRVYQFAKQRKANVLMLVYQSDNGEQNGNGNSPNIALDEIYKQNPEIRMLSQKKRICTINSSSRMESIMKEEDIFHRWLLDALPDDSDTMEHMDYSDIYQIFSRELQHRFPQMQAFLRLFVMCFLGTISVLITLAVLIAITKESGLSADVRRVRSYLRSVIENQRTGKSEWGWKYNAIAITALQLNDPSWCFNSAENQRSVDRMEISLLAELSKLKPYHKGETELTPTYLAMYVNGLVSTFQNPLDFHDHNLAGVLESYLTHYAPYQRLDSFTLAGYVIALCNTGVTMAEQHAELLMKKQRPDGSYPLGVDETAVVVLALSCYPHTPRARIGLTMSVNYLLNQRDYDGSYGSPYTTALVLQAFNESQTPFERRHYETSVNWLLRQAKSKSVLRNIDIAAQVLLTLSGKSMVDVRELTGYIKRFTTDQLEFAQETRGQYTETFKYIKPDSETESQEISDDTRSSGDSGSILNDEDSLEPDALGEQPTQSTTSRRTLNVLTPDQ